MNLLWNRKNLLALAALIGCVTTAPMPEAFAQTETEKPAAEKQEENDKAAEEKPEEKVDITLAEGRIELSVPKAWEKKKPKFNLIEAEFAPKALPAEEDEEADETDESKVTVARLTVMASGGSIEQNIERWIGQFSQEDDSSTGDHTKKKTEKINGMKVHVVSITGTYDDRPGPFAPNGVQRKDYRMLSAIVETKIAGNYFFKMYGPKKIVDDNEERFLEMLKTIKISL